VQAEGWKGGFCPGGLCPTPVTTALSTPIQSDVAALSETGIYGVEQLEETGAGYAFFFIGHPAVGTPQTGGLAVLSSLDTPSHPGQAY